MPDKSSHFASHFASLFGCIIMLLLVAAAAVGLPEPAMSDPAPARVLTGGERLAESGFAALAGKRVGLVTNHTARIGDRHLADLLKAAPGVHLTAILAPEHGFRGAVEAGAKVAHDRDPATGVPVHSLYGATRKPTPAMLRDVDVLLFDIQDVGVRFYTYISTMGLAMQAAAEARIPFMVLDRPNPLGGVAVSGFVLEPRLASFVGQYPIPIQHGLTVGELAVMIKGEHWLPGLEKLDLTIVPMTGWKRHMLWPATRREWIATSPNIPSFPSALTYPGIGFVGEIAVNEGRGTPIPFQQFGAPWLDPHRAAQRLNALALPGVTFEPVRFTPRPIPHVASDPRFAGTEIPGIRLAVSDPAVYRPLETGMHVLAVLVAQAKSAGAADLFVNRKMLRAIAGTERLHALLSAGSDGDALIAAWQSEVAAFNRLRARYLLY